MNWLLSQDEDRREGESHQERQNRCKVKMLTFENHVTTTVYCAAISKLHLKVLVFAAINASPFCF